jgi:hypothetical protein
VLREGGETLLGKPAVAPDEALLGKPAVATGGKAGVATGGKAGAATVDAAARSDFDVRPLTQRVVLTAVTTSTAPPTPRARIDGNGLRAADAWGATDSGRPPANAGAEVPSGCGTVMVEPHFGHLVFFPAAFSSTWKQFWHCGHAKRIMAFLPGNMAPPTRSKRELSHPRVDMVNPPD